MVSAALVATGATAAVAAPAKAAAPKVTLQVKDGKKWLSLPNTAKVTDSASKLTDKFARTGVEVLRVKDGPAVAKSVTITIK